MNLPGRTAQACRKMGEFERDEPAADECDTLGQLSQVQKIITGNQMGCPVYGQGCRQSPGGDNHIPALIIAVVNVQGMAIQKLRLPRQIIDISAFEACDGIFGNF